MLAVPSTGGCDMAHDAVQAKRATYEGLRRVPDIMIAQIIDGELVVSRRPASPHAFAASGIIGDLLVAYHGLQARAGPGGWWILREPELYFADDVLVPDFAGWCCTRMPIVPDVAGFTLAPDWICEILSPSSVRYDRIAKIPFAEAEMHLARWWLPAA
jgi:Uma2 family endonuclease